MIPQLTAVTTALFIGSAVFLLYLHTTLTVTSLRPAPSGDVYHIQEMISSNTTTHAYSQHQQTLHTNGTSKQMTTVPRDETVRKGVWSQYHSVTIFGVRTDLARPWDNSTVYSNIPDYHTVKVKGVTRRSVNPKPWKANKVVAVHGDIITVKVKGSDFTQTIKKSGITDKLPHVQQLLFSNSRNIKQLEKGIHSFQRRFRNSKMKNPR